MSRSIVFFSSFIVAMLSACPFCGSLEVKVTGFKSDKGLARILLVFDEKSFSESDPAKINKAQVFWRSEKIKNKEVTFNFPELKSALYAYKVFHDENENELLDTNLLGKPLEGISISNYKPNTKERLFLFSKASFNIKPKAKVKRIEKISYL